MTVDASRPNFADWLFDQLNERDMSYRALGRRVGVHASTVGHWVSGRSVPEAPNVLKVAEVFGADGDMLLDLAGHRPLGKSPEEYSRERTVRAVEDAVNDLRRALNLDDPLGRFFTERLPDLAPEDRKQLEEIKAKYET